MGTNTRKQMWATRPARIPDAPSNGAVIGGVCEGIGARYQIDPTFVRVLFAALSLVFGSGIFLYLLCWINMPRPGMSRSPWNTITTPKNQLTAMEKKDRDTGWLLLVGLLLFFPTISTAGDARVLLVMLALFLLGWYVAHQRQPEVPEEMVPATVSSSSESLESVKKRYWLWIPLTVVLTVLTMVALSLVSQLRLGNYGKFGSADITVSDIDQLPDLDRFIGETRLDLSELEPLDTPRTVEISNVAGNVEIILPDNAPVDVNCKVTFGDTACPDDTQNADTGGELLTLNVTQRAGSVSAFYARDNPGARE